MHYCDWCSTLCYKEGTIPSKFFLPFYFKNATIGVQGGIIKCVKELKGNATCNVLYIGNFVIFCNSII